MIMDDCYDREGKKITLEQWCILTALDQEYRIVKQEHIGPYYVSTVWLGINQDFFGHSNKPVIFETMIFYICDEKDELDQDMERYCTEEEALAGHEKMVLKCLEAIKDAQSEQVN